MSYIGIDYGTKRVGVAVSDEGSVMAFPTEVVGRAHALERVLELAREREATTIVIGESKDFHNQDNPVMAEIKRFAAELGEKTGAAIIFEPEFLTSAEAKNRGASGDMLDASAAALILQSYLDKHKGEISRGDTSTQHPSSSDSAKAALDRQRVTSENFSEPISIDDFKKLDIRIGEIIFAEKLPNADKLLRLEVSFGEEKRQIVSGISAYFPDPNALVGKKVAFAYNLAPRTIRGHESQGMILAAMDDAGAFSLLETNGLMGGAHVK